MWQYLQNAGTHNNLTLGISKQIFELLLIWNDMNSEIREDIWNVYLYRSGKQRK